MTLQYVNRGDPIKADTINGLIDACSGPQRASTGGFYQTKDGPIFYDDIDWSPYNNDQSEVTHIQRPWEVEIHTGDDSDNISVMLYNPTYIRGKKLHTAEMSSNVVSEVPKSLSSDGSFMFCSKFGSRTFPSFLSGESLKSIWSGFELSDFNPRSITDDQFLLSVQNRQDEILSSDLSGMPSSQLVAYIRYSDGYVFYFNSQPSFGQDNNYNNLWAINEDDDIFENTYVMAGTELMKVDAGDIKPSQIEDGILYVDIGLSSKVDTMDLSAYMTEQNVTDDVYIPIYLFEQGEVILDFRSVPAGVLWSPIKSYMQKGED